MKHLLKICLATLFVLVPFSVCYAGGSVKVCNLSSNSVFINGVEVLKNSSSDWFDTDKGTVIKIVSKGKTWTVTDTGDSCSAGIFSFGFNFKLNDEDRCYTKKGLGDRYLVRVTAKSDGSIHFGGNEAQCS